MRFEKVETIRLSDFRRALGQVAFLSYAAVRIVQGDFSTLLEMTVEPLCGRIQRVPFKGEGGRGLQPRKLLRFSVLTALWAEGYGGGCAADFIGRLRLAALATHPLYRGGQGRYGIYFCVTGAAWRSAKAFFLWKGCHQRGS